jgi:hypothetical protein
VAAQIVPESIRTSVYAFDRCITGAIGAAFTPLTGILAERLFGFTRNSRPGGGAVPPAVPGGHPSAAANAAHYAENVVNARALENGLVWVMLVPMVRTRARSLRTCALLVWKHCLFPCLYAVDAWRC